MFFTPAYKRVTNRTLYGREASKGIRPVSLEKMVFRIGVSDQWDSTDRHRGCGWEEVFQGHGTRIKGSPVWRIRNKPVFPEHVNWGEVVVVIRSGKS